MMLPLGALIIAAHRGAVVCGALSRARLGATSARSSSARTSSGITAGYGVNQDRSLWFYIPVLFGDSFPLSPVLIAAAVATWRERDRFTVLLWCWIGVFVGFFSLSAGKQDLYIFPTIAAVVGLIAAAIERGRVRPEWRAWTVATLAVAAFVTAVVGVGVLWLFSTAGRIYALNGAVAVGAFGLIGGVAALVLMRTKRLEAAVIALLTAMIAINWTFVLQRSAEFRALQAGTGNRPHARIPSRAR